MTGHSEAHNGALVITSISASREFEVISVTAPPE